ncbi:glycoside hydrolase family 140 protein [Marinoscillum sp. MHG1-6]|uniref:glycoside hydrolase family 140 protein n=1 Tax=Marinoscillum sp. MHG1-6 TaxID=2959627 RepID=UPI0021573542|nr:glycoside hydrolase family 140 protein [Marinoscillum sp. MHG1-6]
MPKIDHLLNSGLIVLMLSAGIFSCQKPEKKEAEITGSFRPIKISENQRFFQYDDGEPFFWLGDTGWLIFKKLDRGEIIKYLDDRKDKGYNVIQVMLLHNVDVESFQGDKALVDNNVATPNVTEGDDPNDPEQYDYWDHVAFAVEMAQERDMFMACVPVWGTPVSNDNVTVDEAKDYASFLANRFKDYPNIIWLNGGDIRGDDHQEVWLQIGATLDSLDDQHLITFHPRGRTMSSEWFHDESWLDFNMFQSGHRNYDQDTAYDSHRFGPDNWKYISVEYNKQPTKPTLDGEPSYEGIPHGLHDTTEVYWNADDIRRYAYWSVFAGGAGFTYGHNAVMQFYRAEDNGNRAFGAREFWIEGLNHPGAGQMEHLKTLMLSKPYFERIPDQGLIVNQGERYDYIVGTKGEQYAMIYTYTGRDMEVNMGRIKGNEIKASWFDPRSGTITEAGVFQNRDTATFDPPGEPKEGNDWVLILEKI